MKNTHSATFFLILICSNYIVTAFPIEHWIVLMMENRSFDHLLGFLKRDADKRIDGLTGDESNPYNPFDKNSKTVKVTSTSSQVDPNAGHSYDATLREIFGGENMTHLNPAPMNGFVAEAESMSPGWGPEVMSCFNQSTLPVLSTLALEFGLFDSWFSSLPGPTQPNRAFLQSCSSNGELVNDPWNLTKGFPQPTLMASLYKAGYSFKVYYELFPTALFMDELREYPFHFHGYSQFKTDCDSGNLPTYSFVEPRYYSVPFAGAASDQHPSHNIEDGEIFIKDVYETLRNSPSWEKSALIITYDEHGGYFDHVPIPLNVPNPDGINSGYPFNFNFDRLGVRVPTVIVSPWIPKGTLIHEPNGPTPTSQYEHCSISATMRKVLNISTLPLNKRDAWASPFDHVFTLSSPRQDCPTTLPTPPTPVNDASFDQPYNDLQLEMMVVAQKIGGSDDDDDLRAIRTEKEAGEYVHSRVQKFFEMKKRALLAENHEL